MKLDNMLKHYILVNDKVKVVDLMTWANWFENPKNPGRITKQTVVNNIVRVSTVFLGLDHSWGGKKPVLWETMMFDVRDDKKPLMKRKRFEDKPKLKPLHDYQVRYVSLKDAKAGHEYAVKFAEYILGIRKTEPKESANML